MSKSSFASLVSGALLVASIAFGAAAQAEQVLNAHYEIDVTDHDSTNSVRSTFRVKAGESEQLEMNPNVVEFTVKPVSDREYDLVVVVRAKSQALSVRLSKTFRGTFGVPLEMNASAEAMQVSGAISVVVLDNKQA